MLQRIEGKDSSLINNNISQQRNNYKEYKNSNY